MGTYFDFSNVNISNSEIYEKLDVLLHTLFYTRIAEVRRTHIPHIRKEHQSKSKEKQLLRGCIEVILRILKRANKKRQLLKLKT